MSRYKDTTAIITGGGAGIGRALGEQLAAKGTTVYLADVNHESLSEAAAAIQSNGHKAHAVQLDVTDADAMQKLVRSVYKKHGRLDYMFNNAGIAIGGDARDVSLPQWAKVLDINLNGVIYGTVSAYKIMAGQGFGHIVNTASGTGLLPQPGNTPYATSKHAIVGMSLSLRAEGADLGVKVSAVCPGYVQTNIIKSMEVMKVSREDAIKRLPKKAVSAEDAAAIILRGIERNDAIIIFPWSVKLVWRLHRWFPKAMEQVWVKRMRDFRSYRQA